jgi:hypothetical protein
VHFRRLLRCDAISIAVTDTKADGDADSKALRDADRSANGNAVRNADGHGEADGHSDRDVRADLHAGCRLQWCAAG